MIHTLLLELESALPFSPTGLVIVAACLLSALVLWLFGRSRNTLLFSVAIACLAAGLAVGLVGLDRPADPIRWGDVEDLAEALIGPAGFRHWEQITAAGSLLALGLLYLVYDVALRPRPGEQARRQLERDKAQRQALGSARLCAPKTFRRWRKPDPRGWTLQGQFWGTRGSRLGTRLCLSGEDIARGVAVFGPQGTGKTQCVILPAIADRMRSGHSLVVTDVQGELQPYIEHIAAVTGHALFVHNPSDPAGSVAINLCDWVRDVADARSMAAVLLSEASFGDPFWTKAAMNLVAACALHYPSLGQAVDARSDLPQMARDLSASRHGSVKYLAGDFSGSMRTQDPRLALNIMATAFNIGLSPWCDPAIREISDTTDLDLAAQLAAMPTVLILRCSRLHSEAYGPYLGTILRVLTNRLDNLGEQAGGALPLPVGLILEEFPALGRLSSLVRDINLVRKRRISVLTAAQSLAQFDHVYPGRGETAQLLAGLATKIVFGGCDERTAEYFSELSGQQTLALSSLSESADSHGGATASLRGRALLLPDDIIRPEKGHATVFAAYSGPNGAAQAIFHAELAPFFRRRDWRLDRVQPQVPLTVLREEREAPAAEPPEPAEVQGQDLPDPPLDLLEEWAKEAK